MAGAPRHVVGWTVDRGDRIVGVDDDFLAFARQNAAPELTREFLVGRPLWSFVEGEEIRALYRLLFARVREEGSAFVVPFRCDAPDRFRFMELHLEPAEDAVVQCEGRLLREQRRPALPLLDRMLPRASTHFPMCSVCLRLFVGGSWLEVDEAVRRLDLLAALPPPALDPALCDECRHAARREPDGGAPSGP